MNRQNEYVRSTPLGGPRAMHRLATPAFKRSTLCLSSYRARQITFRGPSRPSYASCPRASRPLWRPLWACPLLGFIADFVLLTADGFVYEVSPRLVTALPAAEDWIQSQYEGASSPGAGERRVPARHGLQGGRHGGPAPDLPHCRRPARCRPPTDWSGPRVAQSLRATPSRPERPSDALCWQRKGWRSLGSTGMDM